MAARAAAMKKLADAAEPLYNDLDDCQRANCSSFSVPTSALVAADRIFGALHKIGVEASGFALTLRGGGRFEAEL
jgi:hypothetical protein